MATEDRPHTPQAQALTHGVRLAPVRRRRARISHSPVKNAPQTQSQSQSQSQTPPGYTPNSHSSTFPGSRPKEPDAQYHLSTSAVEFEGFSFRDDNGCLAIGNTTKDQLMIVENYLAEYFGACFVDYQGPVLIVTCEADRLPPEGERPFTIAGLVAFWRTIDEPGVATWFVGSFGRGPEIKIDPRILAKIDAPDSFPDEVVLYLADYVFTDCVAITTLFSVVVVELPLMSVEAHRARLESLPGEFENSDVILRYYNGTLPNSERRRERAVKPKPKHIDGACDETDYVALDDTFYPGTMLSSANAEGELVSSATAGILVEKGEERRLTCSFHNWGMHYDKYPNKFGETSEEAKRIFQVVQGTNPGTDVGFVRERIGDTNIALAQLHDNVAFDNSFMEMDCVPKRFLRSDEQAFGDHYMLDSFATGKQRLFGFGARRAVGRRDREPQHDVRIPKDMEHLAPSPNVAYLRLNQRVCTTNTPIMNTQPYIRDGVCGAVLLRIGKNKTREAEKDVAARGEIGGMMHFADLQLVNSSDPGNYFIFADVFDPLIDQGWTIAQPSPPGKPPQEASARHKPKRKDPEGDGGDGEDEAALKKQRTCSDVTTRSAG